MASRPPSCTGPRHRSEAAERTPERPLVVLADQDHLRAPPAMNPAGRCREPRLRLVIANGLFDTALTNADRNGRKLSGHRDATSPQTTANFTYITPNLCHDAHDAPCWDGEPGGLATSDAWLRQWVPAIHLIAGLRPRWAAGDHLRRVGRPRLGFQWERRRGASEYTAARDHRPRRRADRRTGAVRLHRARQLERPAYHHYSLLAGIENLFGLRRLGYAASTGLNTSASTYTTADRATTVLVS